MTRSSNQKLKLLYLMRILNERTDEDHPLTIAQLISELAALGVSAERKSLYDDLEALRTYGVDVCCVKGRRTGYFVGGRAFEPAELKLLSDSVQASQFITQKKTVSLIRKLEGLGSAHMAQLMRREVFVANRIKSMNESIYYNVDRIHAGIAEDSRISFKYFEYTVNKRKSYRHGGALYDVSPFALVWDSENYYMVAFDKEAGIFKNYRVDKMDGITTTGAAREGKEEYARLDMAVYARRRFSMYGGEEQTVTIRFANELVGVVLDRFGMDVAITRTDAEHFSISVPVAVSPQFFGWVAGLSDGAKITAPQSVVERMKEEIGRIAAQY